MTYSLHKERSLKINQFNRTSFFFFRIKIINIHVGRREADFNRRVKKAYSLAQHSV